MEVISSTYHQRVSYLTEKGQVNIYGSQLAVRQCYQISIPQKDVPFDKEPSELEVEPNKNEK